MIWLLQNITNGEIFRKAASTQTLAVNYPTDYLSCVLTIVVNTPLFQSTSFSEDFSVDILISIHTLSIDVFKSLKNILVSSKSFLQGRLYVTYSIKTYKESKKCWCKTIIPPISSFFPPSQLCQISEGPPSSPPLISSGRFTLWVIILSIGWHTNQTFFSIRKKVLFMW